MEVKILEKIPLLKIKNKNTEIRILRIYGNRACVIYSELEKGIKKEIRGLKTTMRLIFSHSMNGMRKLVIRKVMALFIV